MKKNIFEFYVICNGNDQYLSNNGKFTSLMLDAKMFNLFELKEAYEQMPLEMQSNICVVKYTLQKEKIFEGNLHNHIYKDNPDRIYWANNNGEKL